MTIYAYNPATGELIRTDNVADWMGTTEAPPPEFDPVTAGCFWRGDHWEIEDAKPPVAPVPEVVTMRQARLALLGAGLLAQVEAAIASMPEPYKTAASIEWEYSNALQRSNPLVAQLGAALGLDDAEIDALFVEAAKL